MKKKSIIILLIVFLIVIGVLFCFKFSDYFKIEEFQNNEWIYVLNKREKIASIKRYSGISESIEISGTVENDNVKYTVVKIEDGAFNECKNLKNVVIPSTVVELGDTAFEGCENLEKLILPDSVKKIGKDTFNNCDKLKNISMNETGEEKNYNENYIDYLKLSDKEKAEVNVIPRKECVPIESLKKGLKASGVQEIPDKFNLNDNIDILVEDQGQSGWCWAYSSLKAVDTYSAINLGVNYNSSEAHLAYMRSSYFGGWIKGYKNSNDVWNTGGSFEMLDVYAKENCNGPVLESEISNKKYEFSVINIEKFQKANKLVNVMETKGYPTIEKNYNEDGTIQYKNGSSICSEQQVNEFRKTIKEHIMNNGGLYTYIECPDDGTVYYNSETAAYFWKGDKSQLEREGGHAVTIIGWDDTYSKNNFNAECRPSNDGAYICLNSWGSNWGKGGYFYISYDDYTVETQLSGVTNIKKVPEKIEITKMPTKLEYIQNFENVDLTGGEITLTYKDGAKEKVSMLDENVSVSGFNNKELGKSEVILKYTLKDKYYVYETSFNVDIVSAILTSIQIENNPTKINYIKDHELLDLTGMEIRKIYNNNELWYEIVENVKSSELEVSGFSNTTLGEKSITIKYQGKTCIFVVNVVEVLSINISTLPTKTLYMKGDASLNLNNGKIEVTYTNNGKAIVDMEDTGFIISGFDTNSLGQKVITIKYYDKWTTTFTIEVLENLFEYETSESGAKITGYKGNGNEIIIPNYFEKDGNIYNVVNLSDDCFSETTGITNIKIPRYLKSIGQAFKEFTKLQNITVDENNDTYVTEDNVLYNKNKTTICLYPKGKQEESFTVPNQVSSIERYAFYKCLNLKQINLSNTIINIGAFAFGNCSNLNNLSLPEGIKIIDECVWKDCTSLEKVNIPSTIEQISATAFDGCSKLKEIVVDEKNNYYTSEDGVLFNKNKTKLCLYPSAKEQCKYDIPTCVNEISVNAFKSCINLVYIEIPNSVNTIRPNAFYGCKNLKSIEIPNGVTELDVGVFKDCINLREIELPNTITSIGKISDDVFSNCRNLKVYTYSDATVVLQYVRNHSNLISKIITNPLENIEIETLPNKVSYKDGEYFCPSGMNINAVYKDGTKTEVEDYIILNEDNLKEGQTSVIILYTEGARTRKAIQTISVGPGDVTKIEIVSEPLKKNYKVGESFDSNGMVVEAVYENNKREKITGYDILNGSNLLLGTESVVISYTRDEKTVFAYQKINVTKVEGKISDIQDLSKTYDGSAVMVPTYNKYGDGIIMIEWYKLNGILESKINNAPKDAGVYKVKVIMKESENYKGTVGEKQFTISKAKGFINNIQIQGKVYNGVSISDPQYTKIGDGIITIEWYKVSGNGEIMIDNAPKNAGKYKVKLIMAETDNYKGTSAEKEFEISKATYDMSSIKFENVSYPYSGEEKQIVISGTLPQGVDVKYENNKGINAGKYTAIAMFNGDFENYNRISNMIAKLTITKINPEYNIPNGLIAIYGQTLKDISLPDGFSWEQDLTTSVGEIGENKFTVKYTPTDMINYNVIKGIEVIIKVKADTGKNIIIDNYEVDEDRMIIGKILPETDIDEFKSHIKNSTEYKIFDKNGKELQEKDKIGTGYKVEVESGKQYTLVVYGDLNGDGKVNVVDIARLQKILTKISNSTDLINLAADLKEDSILDLKDLARLQKLATGQNIFK